MGNSWIESLPKISDGVTTFSEADINPILAAIDGRFTYLKNALEHLSGQCGYIATLSGFTSDCKKGTIIALGDGSSNTTYVPASAVWSAQADGAGNLIPSTTANVVGVLLEDVSNNGCASVLFDGWTADPELIAIMTNNQGTGDYYLSTGGKAILSPPTTGVVVRCFSYVEEGFGGNSCLIFRPQAPEYNGHTHNVYQVDGEWSTGLTAAEVPEDIIQAVQLSGEASKLAIQQGSELIGLDVSTANHLVMVKNGKIVDQDTWCVDSGYIYIAANVFNSDKISISSIYPLTGTTPIVRSVTSSSKLLNISNTAGNIDLSLATSSDGEELLTGRAISELSDNGLYIAPVVHRIYGGVGTTIGARKDINNVDIPGSFEIHCNSTLKQQIDLNVTNLNGVLFGTTEDMVSYVFPVGVYASLNGTLRLPEFEARSVSAKLNIMLRGTGRAISNFNAFIVVNHLPTVDEPTVIEVGNTFELVGPATTQSNNIYLISADLSGLNLKGSDFISVKLASEQAVSSVAVLTTSLELYAK